MTLNLPSVKVQHCIITEPLGLDMRAAPNTDSAIITAFPSGTQLNFIAVVFGEMLQGNPRWGLAPQGYYFWLGGTDRKSG
jgi:hypothetical protein